MGDKVPSKYVDEYRDALEKSKDLDYITWSLGRNPYTRRRMDIKGKAYKRLGREAGFDSISHSLELSRDYPILLEIIDFSKLR